MEAPLSLTVMTWMDGGSLSFLTKVSVSREAVPLPMAMASMSCFLTRVVSSTAAS